MIYLLILAIFIIAKILNDRKQINDGVDTHNLIDDALTAVVMIVISGINAPDWRYIVLHLIAGALIFWFFFDYGLNIARKKPLMYLGDHFLDRLQKNGAGVFPWFVWKALLAWASVYYVLNPEEILKYF